MILHCRLWQQYLHLHLFSVCIFRNTFCSHKLFLLISVSKRVHPQDVCFYICPLQSLLQNKIRMLRLLLFYKLFYLPLFLSTLNFNIKKQYCMSVMFNHKIYMSIFIKSVCIVIFSRKIRKPYFLTPCSHIVI